MSFRNLVAMRKIAFLFPSLLLLVACTKKNDSVTDLKQTGKVTIAIENYAGNQLLKLNDTWYINENGDSLQFTIYNYFISNIKLTNTDGTIFAEDESYHLIVQADAGSKTFFINNVPYGSYKSISYIIGVDSARNVSGAQTGALDQATGMFWDWNTGYVMAKMEANAPRSPNGNVVYHTGGYSGINSSLRTVVFNNLSINVAESKTPQIHIKSDALEWFKTPKTISVKDMPVFGNIAGIKIIADNYADMFTVDHID